MPITSSSRAEIRDARSTYDAVKPPTYDVIPPSLLVSGRTTSRTSLTRSAVSSEAGAVDGTAESRTTSPRLLICGGVSDDDTVGAGEPLLEVHDARVGAALVTAGRRHHVGQLVLELLGLLLLLLGLLLLGLELVGLILQLVALPLQRQPPGAGGRPPAAAARRRSPGGRRPRRSSWALPGLQGVGLTLQLVRLLLEPLGLRLELPGLVGEPARLLLERGELVADLPPGGRARSPAGPRGGQRRSGLPCACWMRRSRIRSRISSRASWRTSGRAFAASASAWRRRASALGLQLAPSAPPAATGGPAAPRPARSSSACWAWSWSPWRSSDACSASSWSAWRSSDACSASSCFLLRSRAASAAWAAASAPSPAASAATSPCCTSWCTRRWAWRRLELGRHLERPVVPDAEAGGDQVVGLPLGGRRARSRRCPPGRTPA